MVQLMQLSAADNSKPVGWRIQRLATLLQAVEARVAGTPDEPFWAGALLGLNDCEGELTLGWLDDNARQRFGKAVEEEWVPLDGGCCWVDHQLVADTTSLFHDLAGPER